MSKSQQDYQFNEQKGKNENQFSEGDEKYKILFEKSQDALLIIQNGKFADCNEATLKMLHYAKKEDFLNTHPSELSPKQQPDGEYSVTKADEMMALAFKNGSHRFEWVHKKSNGELFPVEVLLTAIENDAMNQILHTVWRDITERQKAEMALKESEERFRLLYENSTIGLYRTTPDGEILLANDTLVQMLRFSSSQELISKNLKEHGLVRQDKRSSFLKKIEQDGTIRGLETDWIRKDGTLLPVRESTRTFKDANGKTLYYDGVVEDLTEQKRTELERQALFDIAHGVTLTNNLNELLNLIHESLGKVLYAENYFVALHDPHTGLFSFPYFVDKLDPIPEPSFMEMSCTSYVYRTGNTLLLTEEIFNQLIEQKEVDLVGTRAPSWIGVPLQTPSKIIGVLVLQSYEKEQVYSEKDVQFLNFVGSQIGLIIERKRAEEELSNERTLLRTIIDLIPDAIYVKDAEGRKILANPKEVEISGKNSENEVLGKTDMELFPDRKEMHFLKEDQEVLKEGRSFQDVEGKLVDQEGQIHWLLGLKVPLQGSNGEIIGIVGLNHDITERKRAVAEIQKRNEELSELNAEKDKFFSIIAHDLRSPFNSFLGLTQIMAEELPTLTMDEIQKIAVSLRNSASNLFGLLENLLYWARAKQGLIPFNAISIELSQLVMESTAMSMEPVKTKEIEIVFNIPEDLSVFADNQMMQTIIRNFVSNAVKFTPRGGKIKISAKNTADENVEISIQDTGIGMDKTMIDNLFHIDVQTNRKGTDGEPSSGLGLLICKEFIEKQGGKIWVESKIGVGSTFFFTLPLWVNGVSQRN